MDNIKIDDLIKGYSNKLENLKYHRAENCDKMNDNENDLLDQTIRLVAGFINDLKELK